MDMDQAAVFFAASVLVTLGFLIWVCFILIVNNLVHRYWKSWGWNWMGGMVFPDRPPTRFMTDEEAKSVEPTFDKDIKK